MALHIQDKEADSLVRQFAKQRGVGLTAAIKLAVQDANKLREDRVQDLSKKLEPIWAQIKAARKGRPFSMEEDKAFMDEMWGEND